MPVVAKKKKRKRKRSYRLLRGKHSQGSRKKGTLHIFDASDPDNNLIETTVDLLGLNGPFPMTPKFALAEDHQAVAEAGILPREETEVEEDLEDMSINELRMLAAEEEIDLGRATRIPAIIKAIRRAR